MEVKKSVKEVGELIGGKVKLNIDAGTFVNACPIRMSYVLNKTGIMIPRGAGYAVSSGEDKNWYIYRVTDMMNFLYRTLGDPDHSVINPREVDFFGMKGILVVKGHGWVDAVGHVTLWDGTVCSDSCHFTEDPDNGTFIPDEAALWTLS